jgi:hypothetical protein
MKTQISQRVVPPSLRGQGFHCGRWLAGVAFLLLLLAGASSQAQFINGGSLYGGYGGAGYGGSGYGYGGASGAIIPRVSVAPAGFGGLGYGGGYGMAGYGAAGLGGGGLRNVTRPTLAHEKQVIVRGFFGGAGINFAGASGAMGNGAWIGGPLNGGARRFSP